MTQKEIIELIAEKAYAPIVNVRTILQAAQEVVTEALAKTGKAQIPGLVKYETKTRNERNCRNPENGETLVIPAKTVVQCTPCETLVIPDKTEVRCKPATPIKKAVDVSQ